MRKEKRSGRRRGKKVSTDELYSTAPTGQMQ
jgi:hypothetical protein